MYYMHFSLTQCDSQILCESSVESVSSGVMKWTRPDDLVRARRQTLLRQHRSHGPRCQCAQHQPKSEDFLRADCWRTHRERLVEHGMPFHWPCSCSCKAS